MKRIATLVSLLVCSSVFANPSQSQSFWEDVDESAASPVQQIKQLKFRSLQVEKQPLKKRTLNLDESSFRQFLFSAGNAKLSVRSFRSKQAQATPELEVDLPLPNGKFVRVKAIDSSVLSEELALTHPEIKTWRVVGVDDPAISGRIDFTEKGFHGMLVMEDGETIFIDPDQSQGNIYHSLSKRKNAAHFNLDFNCETHGEHSVLSKTETRQLSAKTLKIKELAQIPAKKLITYRLAIASTAEFTAKLGGKSLAYSSIVTTINRVNEIYQRDIGIKLQLVTDEQFVYTNANTDPYTNDDKKSLVNENATNLANNFGVANFDVGHVFAHGALGGLAYVGVVCADAAYIRNSANQQILLNGIKGGGATGIIDPQGEIFSVDFVSHEIGHQLGAHHTFNSTKKYCGGGGRSSEAAVEPGSGSTIMAYSGLCDTDNLQHDADAMFHWKSIEQINKYTRIADPAGYDNGSNCGVRTSTGQQLVVDAGSDNIIPLNTPFLLNGSATGTNASYTWDQIDNGSASVVDDDKGDNAIIRALLPTANPDRYIPRLSDIFAGTKTLGESLPQTVRDMNFAFVVRDGNGGIGSDFKKISTTNTTGFGVTSQSNNQILSTLQTINVNWNIGGTNAAPINCSKVDIQLLRVNGVKNMLLADTNNDGSEQFNIPGTIPAMTGARIMVACTSQPFFQISTGNITIQQGVDNTAPVITITGQKNIEIVKGSTYTDAGATATDDFDSIVSVITAGTVDTATLGTYTITYTATDNAGNTATATRTITVIPDTVAPVITLNGLTNISVYQGVNYTDAGATVSDNVDENIVASSIGTVDTNVLGVYSITYSAIDSSGNNATSVTRTITVVADTTAPVITLIDASTVEVFVGENYTDAGATAMDNVDGVVTASSVGTVDTATVGSYEITYTAVDNAGNTTVIKRTINVIADTLAPVISLKGNANMDIIKGLNYIEAGATATDNKDGSVAVSISGIVDTSVLGNYTITYTAIDQAGNSTPVTRTVNVVADTGAPIITLNGDSVVRILQDSTYIDAGASAVDSVDGQVSVITEGVDDIDTAVVGSYTIVYTAMDSSGNTTTKARVVIVEADEDNGSKQLTSSKSGGGSFGFLLLPLVMLGLRRRILKLSV
ncbi:MAG: DUF5011 domain-containing protein [Cocleimonas sp.]|nr:DUF5011 domain-containing protein [Cocleimonas sp.]